MNGDFGERPSQPEQVREPSTLIDRRTLVRLGAATAMVAPFIGATTWSQSAVARYLAQESGAELAVAASSDIDTLDPHVSQLLLYGNTMRRTCFSSLVKYGPSLEYLPDLAESWENEDDRTYLFHLRPGVTYHNGQEVEASDVEFSLQRIAEKQTVFSSRVANVEAYEVVDTHTIRITLKTVQADFIDGLTKLSIISPEAEETIESQPVGSGPFRFVEWQTNDRIVLERNPDYFEDGVPGVDALTFRIMPEPQVALTNLRAGEVDGILEFPVTQAAFLTESTDAEPLIVPTSGIHIFEMMGKNSEPIRSSIQVRQALAHCMDKAAIQETAFAGQGRPKASFVPIDSWAYAEQEDYAYDTEMAKSLLTEAGYGDGFEFTCIIPSGNPEGEQATTIWQAGLKEAGVSLNLEVQELSVWLDNYINHTYDVSWNAFPGFADPNYFVSFALQPHFADQWNNPEAEELANEANAVLDQEQRSELYAQLQGIFVEEAPILVIQEIPAASVVAPEVEGWSIDPLGAIHLNTASLS